MTGLLQGFFILGSELTADKLSPGTKDLTLVYISSHGHYLTLSLGVMSL